MKKGGGIDRGASAKEQKKKRRESDTMAFVKEIKNKAYFKRFQVKLKRREMVLDIIEQVGKTSRFLVWNEGGWWNEIPDREHLILKIEYLIKEVRKSKREAQTVNLNSSTSIFYSNKRPKLDERGGNTDGSDEDKSFPYGGRKGCL